MRFLTLQKSSKISFYVSLKEGIHRAGLCPKAALLFLGFSSPVSAFPLPSLTSKCLNMPSGTQRRGHRKTSVPRTPRVLLGFGDMNWLFLEQPLYGTAPISGEIMIQFLHFASYIFKDIKQ